MLQSKLYLKAKAEPAYRFYLLYDKIYCKDILTYAYELAKANPAVPGVDGQNLLGDRGARAGEVAGGHPGRTSRQHVRATTGAASNDPEARGRQRPLGIPTIRDRVLKIGARIRVTVHKIWLLMTLGYPWQGLFRQAWTQLRC